MQLGPVLTRKYYLKIVLAEKEKNITKEQVSFIGKITENTLAVRTSRDPDTSNSPYVQDWSAQNFVQDAGLTGRGWLFGHPECSWENATSTRGGAAWLPLRP